MSVFTYRAIDERAAAVEGRNVGPFYVELEIQPPLRAEEVGKPRRIRRMSWRLSELHADALGSRGQDRLEVDHRPQGAHGPAAGGPVSGPEERAVYQPPGQFALLHAQDHLVDEGLVRFGDRTQSRRQLVVKSDLPALFVSRVG